MIRIAAIAAALAALAVPASAAVADGLAARAYLHIQVALANDSTSGVAEAAARCDGSFASTSSTGLVPKSA